MSYGIPADSHSTTSATLLSLTLLSLTDGGQQPVPTAAARCWQWRLLDPLGRWTSPATAAPGAPCASAASAWPSSASAAACDRRLRRLPAASARHQLRGACCRELGCVLLPLPVRLSRRVIVRVRVEVGRVQLEPILHLLAPSAVIHRGPRENPVPSVS